MAKEDHLQPEHNVARYCGPVKVGTDGLPTVAAFQPKPNADHLSVNWLEHFQSSDKELCIGRVREAFLAKPFELKAAGRFAVLNTGQAVQCVKNGAGVDIRVIHWPEDNDPSHSGIFDYTSEDLQVALDLKSIVTTTDVYPGLG